MINWDAVVIGPLMGVFGEPVIYTPFGGAAFQITGVFDDAYLAVVVLDDGTAGLTELSAVIGVQLSQFAVPPAQNGRLVVKRTGAKFIVREVRNDSHGWAKLLLTRAA
jgi:hypothetical protein